MNKKQQDDLVTMYNQGWAGVLENGCEDFGDLDASLLFINRLDIPKESKILEIGCAVGNLCNELSKMNFTDITGIDISDAAINYGKNKYPHLNISSYEGINLNFSDETFDILLSFDVVEHITDIDSHFQEAVKILRPSGRYIFQTPNILSNSVFETIRCKGKMTWKRYHPSLQFSFSLKKKLMQSGFKRVEFVKISPLTEYKLVSIPIILRYMLKIIPWTFLPVWLQTNFFVIAYKR